MPSIPQSLLWISLVVLWLFVLVPMLVSKRDAVRRTSDVALATRVLNSDTTGRLIKRVGVSAGHRSDPDWRPEEDEYDELDDVDSDDADDAPTSRVVVTVAAEAPVEEAGADYLDVDVIDPHSPALSAGDTAAEDENADDANTEVTVAVEHHDDEDTAFDDDDADQYEYVDDTSGIPVAAEEPLTGSSPTFSRRHQHDADTAAAVSARKYAFRRRVLTIMASTLVVTAATAFLLTSSAWWLFSVTSVATVLYLGYLRRQTRIEERVQRRRMQRMARSQLGVENTYDREYDVVPSRLRRPGAVVLEIDDEDPIFEHLEYAPYARDYSWHRDLQRAAGQ
jgi:hypothetical protein